MESEFIVQWSQCNTPSIALFHLMLLKVSQFDLLTLYVRGSLCFSTSLSIVEPVLSGGVFYFGSAKDNGKDGVPIVFSNRRYQTSPNSFFLISFLKLSLLNTLDLSLTARGSPFQYPNVILLLYLGLSACSLS